MKRMEAVSDVVFGYALTLLVVSLEVPAFIPISLEDAQLSRELGQPDTEEELQRIDVDSTRNRSSVLTTMVVGVVYPVVAKDIIVPRPYRHQHCEGECESGHNAPWRFSSGADAR
jgi:hypothetical protein